MINSREIDRTNLTTLFGLINKYIDYLDASGCAWNSYYRTYYLSNSVRKKINESLNYIDFNHNLRNIKNRSESNRNRKIAKYFLYLYCVRNYTGHHFNMKHIRSEFLFKYSDKRQISINADIVFWNIFGAIFYINESFR